MSKCSHWISGVQLPYTKSVGQRIRLKPFGAMVLVAEEIGINVIICQNTTCDRANGVVIKNIPFRSTVGGITAKVLKALP